MYLILVPIKFNNTDEKEKLPSRIISPILGIHTKISKLELLTQQNKLNANID